MKKEYMLIENENFKVMLSFEGVDFDYYTDVCMELLFNNTPIILFKDNLLALKNLMDHQGRWIGEKYCWFQVSKYAAWVYRYDKKIILKVTPVFGGFEEDDHTQKYKQFIRKYSDVFRGTVELQELINMKKIIDQLYNELL